MLGIKMIVTQNAPYFMKFEKDDNVVRSAVTAAPDCGGCSGGVAQPNIHKNVRSRPELF